MYDCSSVDVGKEIGQSTLTCLTLSIASMAIDLIIE